MKRCLLLFLILNFSFPLLASWKKIAPGVAYEHFKKGKLSAYVTRVDLTDDRIRVIASDPSSQGVKLTDFAKQTNAVVAINGDYFDEKYKPVGLAIGQCGAWPGSRDTTREGFIAVGGEQAKIYPQAQVIDPPEAWMDAAVSGWPMIVRDCHALTSEELPGSDHFTRAAHPRTAVGLSSDGKTLFLVVAEGRQQDAPGATLAELGRFIHDKLGACSAINFDGGGSSEMVVNGEIVNRPSDGVERRLGNHLAVVLATEAPVCDQSRQSASTAAATP